MVESWAQAELEEELLAQTGFKLTLELRPELKPQGLKLPSDAPPPPPLSAEERLKAFPPKRRFLPSAEALTRPYRQTLIADKVRSACRRDMARPKKLRAFKGHIEVVITRAQFTPTLRASLKALAEESGWPIAVELKG